MADNKIFTLRLLMVNPTWRTGAHPGLYSSEGYVCGASGEGKSNRNGLESEHYAMKEKEVHDVHPREENV